MRVRTEPFGLVGAIAQEAGVPCHVDGTATLIACDHAEAFLEGCRIAKVRVIGVEGFELIGGQRRPHMRAILDLGELNEAARSQAEARRFVASVCRPGLRLEFQLERA